jgi:hypothetical protein
MYGCETLSLQLNEDYKLRAFKIMVLRKMFGPKRKEVTGWWSKLCNEELCDLYDSANIISVMKSRKSDGQGICHWRIVLNVS